MADPVDRRVAAAALGKVDTVEESWLPNLVAGNSIWDLTRDLNAPRFFDGRLLEPDVHGRANLPDEVAWELSGLVPLEELARIDPARASRALEALFDAAERTAAAFDADPRGFGRYRDALTLPATDSAHYFYSPDADAIRVKNWGATARRAEHKTTHVSHGLGELRAASRASQPPIGGEDGADPTGGAARHPPARSRLALPLLLLALLLVAGLAALALWPTPPAPEPEPADASDAGASEPLEDAGPREPLTRPPPPIPAPHQRVFFALGDHSLSPDQTASLEAIAELLREHPRVSRLRVEGHADVLGREANNRALSGERAGRVVRWLREQGIAADRLEAAACSELHPLADHDDDEGRRQNRRVEFFVVAPTGGPAPHEGCARVFVD